MMMALLDKGLSYREVDWTVRQLRTPSPESSLLNAASITGSESAPMSCL
jgi:hypothetical protein